MTSLLCEHRARALPGGEPIFSKAIALDYRDGPSWGAVQCASCTAAYRFDLLAIDVDGSYDRAAWDRGEELRVFGLAILPTGGFERVVNLLSSVEHPRWPIWAPTMTGTAAELPALVETEVVPLLEAAGSTRLVVATQGLLAPIRVSRAIDGRVNDRKWSDRDWFSLVGLSAQQPATLHESP